MRLFVYGSLRKGLMAHDALEGAEYLGEYTTPPAWKMYDLGMFPALVKGGDTPIKGEVYEVDRELLARLDQLERVPDLYVRSSIMTEYGKAVVYIMHNDIPNAKRVSTGDWYEYSKVF